jgi:diaminohydroxyphosphoribosylaminopyrimidine deaminase / 5-amino-6-(5-phosphoribosylamino)uracil reductase
MVAAVEVAAMRRAIALSAGGLGATSPNPPVGCVLLDQDGHIVGEGHHERKGEAHAEANAIAAAGALADGATAVVTLEPCNHYGRTPACRQTLIDAGVKRVVIALIDPTSRGEGGAAALRAAGVDVETGVLAGEARVVLGPWLTALEQQRPLITWPYLITGDGIAPLPGTTGEAQRLRLNADAVLSADGTVAEAIPGRHGAGILTLTNPATGTGPADVASALYAGGVRRLILDGGLKVARPYLAASLVDSVLAYVPDGSASGKPRGDLPWAQIPPGFAITAACRIDGFARIEGRRDVSSRG